MAAPNEPAGHSLHKAATSGDLRTVKIALECTTGKNYLMSLAMRSRKTQAESCCINVSVCLQEILMTSLMVTPPSCSLPKTATKALFVRFWMLVPILTFRMPMVLLQPVWQRPTATVPS